MDLRGLADARRADGLRLGPLGSGAERCARTWVLSSAAVLATHPAAASAGSAISIPALCREKSSRCEALVRDAVRTLLHNLWQPPDLSYVLVPASLSNARSGQIGTTQVFAVRELICDPTGGLGYIELTTHVSAAQNYVRQTFSSSSTWYFRSLISRRIIYLEHGFNYKPIFLAIECRSASR